MLHSPNKAGSGMRILPDAKDLINLVERAEPLGLREFHGWLEQNEAKLVLTLTNVLEFAAPLGQDADRLGVRANLQALESLPVCYLSAAIVQDELRSAVRAFDSGAPYQPIDPYVRRWDEVLVLAEPSVAGMYVNYRLDEIVFDVWRGNRTIFERFRSNAPMWRELMAVSRDVTTGKFSRAQEDTYWILIERHLTSNSISPPEDGVQAFSRWLYSDPRRCPGIRVLYEVLRELQQNVGDKPKDGDLGDLAYVPAIPYVDAITLDRRMASYCKNASSALKRDFAECEYTGRIYLSFRELMDRQE